MIASERCEPGTSLRRHSASGVREKLPPVVLGKDAHARQGTEQPVKRPRMGLRGRSQVVGSPGAILQQVGQAQLGGDVKGLGNPVAGEHPTHLLLR